MNHGGRGNKENDKLSKLRGKGRNGASTTVRSGLSNRQVLCTTPMPLCTSARVGPGKGPQVACGVKKPKPVHALIAMVP